MNSLVRLFSRPLAWCFGRTGDVTVDACSSVNWWKLGGRGGRIRIGSGSAIHCRVDFDAHNGEVSIGDRSYIGASHIVCHTRVSIGDDVIISWGVTLADHNSHSLDWSERLTDVASWKQGLKNWNGVAVAPVRICDKVWIGFGASILKGVEIGEGAVVGAQAVVTRSVPPYTVVAGNPARVIRELPRPTGPA